MENQALLLGDNQIDVVLNSGAMLSEKLAFLKILVDPLNKPLGDLIGIILGIGAMGYKLDDRR